MVYSLTYRRPAYVKTISSASSINSEKSTKAESVSSGASCPYGIPEALSFDRILDGGTCPPCTIRDFMNFLLYIEHAAENLQFFLWLRGYSKRFEELPASDKALSPEWTIEQAEAEAQAAQSAHAPTKKLSPEVAAIFTGTDFDGTKLKPPGTGFSPNPFHTPPRTPGAEGVEEGSSVAPGSEYWSETGSTIHAPRKDFQKAAASAFEGAKQFQPYTIQPFREEVSRIVSIYIANDSNRQLNLSDRERQALLHALSITTHPSAFRGILQTVEWALRHQAHPNFIRWTICNGNRPRVIFARGLGVVTIVGGVVCAIILTLSSAGRGWRALSAIALVIGIATLIAAWKGMCVVLHGMHHRHVRPWEMFADDKDAASDFEMSKESFETAGTKNSYEDEPWVAKYEKRNVIRKVFDREVWIQEPALRQIQDTIFIQAMVGAIVISAVIVGVFVAIPKGGYF